MPKGKKRHTHEEVMPKLTEIISSALMANLEGTLQLMWDEGELLYNIKVDDLKEDSESEGVFYLKKARKVPEKGTRIFGWNGREPENPPMYYSEGVYEKGYLLVSLGYGRGTDAVRRWRELEETKPAKSLVQIHREENSKELQ